ncbi:MAG TPA: kelch repeat-containing protein [Acidimicrobiia bacterium]
MALTTLALLAAACGGGGDGASTAPSTTPASVATTVATSPPTTAPASRLDATTLSWSLPAPRSREVALVDRSSLVVLGGQDAAHASVADVYRIDPGPGTTTNEARLDPAVHDAAGVQLGDDSVVIAGGTPPARATVQAVATGRPTRALGDLPVARTDHVAALLDGTIFVLGGGDASEVTLDSVVASPDGATWSDAGTLVEGVRYPAIAVVDGAIYLFGGARASGPDTVSVQRYDPKTHTTEVVARLPAPLSHASAVVLGGQVWVLGGYVNDTPSQQILRFDPTTRAISAAGSLPAAVTDAAAVTTDPTTGYLVGGEGPGRTTTAAVVVLRAH